MEQIQNHSPTNIQTYKQTNKQKHHDRKKNSEYINNGIDVNLKENGTI